MALNPGLGLSGYPTTTTHKAITILMDHWRPVKSLSCTVAVINVGGALALRTQRQAP